MMFYTTLFIKELTMNQAIEFDVLEMYYNETKDYDTIAERFDITTLDVANIINDDMEKQK
jgi:hypothetical protein